MNIYLLAMEASMPPDQQQAQEDIRAALEYYHAVVTEGSIPEAGDQWPSGVDAVVAEATTTDLVKEAFYRQAASLGKEVLLLTHVPHQQHELRDRLEGHESITVRFATRDFVRRSAVYLLLARISNYTLSLDLSEDVMGREPKVEA